MAECVLLSGKVMGAVRVVVSAGAADHELPLKREKTKDLRWMREVSSVVASRVFWSSMNISGLLLGLKLLLGGMRRSMFLFNTQSAGARWEGLGLPFVVLFVLWFSVVLESVLFEPMRRWTWLARFCAGTARLLVMTTRKVLARRMVVPRVR